MSTLPPFISFSEALTDLIRTDEIYWQAKNGGAGWNIARVMAALGTKSAFAGAISCDVFGNDLWQASEAANLDMRFLQRYPKSPLLAIVHQSNPVRYFFIGDDSADLYFDCEKLPAGWQKKIRLAYFGAISLTREPLASTLITIAKGLKKIGVTIAYDPNFRAVMDERYDKTLKTMCGLADIIKVSDEDLCGLYRTDHPETALSQLINENPQASILFTEGEKGASLFEQAAIHCWKGKPPATSVIDTVGAGDASFGGLLNSMMNHPMASGATHLSAALATGAAACMVAGAGLPHQSVIQKMIGEVVVERKSISTI